ncbi:hypothetical protein ACLB2K_031202 [Fragaria x ananassa]
MPPVGIANGGGKEYAGVVNRYVIQTSIIAAMGGLIFGYDIGISGGAALIASVVAAFVTRKFGRKRSMFFGGVLFCVGAAINAAAMGVWMLIFWPDTPRFRYRILQSVCAALLLRDGAIQVQRTHTKLYDRARPARRGRDQLRRIRGVDDVREEFSDLILASDEYKKIENPLRNLRQRKYRPQLCMAILIPFFQQFTGINVIMFYAPGLFNTIGFGSDASLISAVITGSVDVIATGVSMYGVDKWGRRKLFLEGGTQMLICQIVVAVCIGAKFGLDGNVGNLPAWYAIVVVTFICTYVAAFAWSWGPLGWLVPSEIFPLEIRSAAQSINVSVNMIFTFVVAQVFLTMLCHLKFGLFFFFTFFMCLSPVGILIQDYVNKFWIAFK